MNTTTKGRRQQLVGNHAAAITTRAVALELQGFEAFENARICHKRVVDMTRHDTTLLLLFQLKFNESQVMPCLLNTTTIVNTTPIYELDQSILERCLSLLYQFYGAIQLFKVSRMPRFSLSTTSSVSQLTLSSSFNRSAVTHCIHIEPRDTGLLLGVGCRVSGFGCH